MSKEGFEFVEFDFDAVWAALSKSSQLRGKLEALAKEVENNATAKARTEAYDEGYYTDLFKSGVDASSTIRKLFTKDYQTRRNRSRRGTISRFIDRPVIKGEDGKETRIKGDIDGSEYNGSLGYVINEDFKAIWVEYGSMAKGPKFILSRATEEVANRNEGEWQPLYAKTHEQNITELKARQAKGKAETAKARKANRGG
jgi:hypothetical protein